MFFSKIVLVTMLVHISLAAAVAKDTSDCPSFPKEEVTLGQHAMLQQAAKPSKGDILALSNDVVPPADPMAPFPTSIDAGSMEKGAPTGDVLTAMDNAVSPMDSMMQPGLQGEARMPANSMDVMGQADLIGEQAVTGVPEATADTMANVSPQMEEQEGFLANPVSTDFVSSATTGSALTSSVSKLEETVDIPTNAQPQMEEQEVLLTNPVPTDSLSSPTAGSAPASSMSKLAETVDILTNARPQMEEQELLSEACDWQCYLNRYPDLLDVVGVGNMAAAEQHWNSVGKKEGRDCTCAAGESLAVADGAANDAQLASQFTASANVMDAVTSCQPLSPEAQAEMQAEIQDYEASEKFQEKILEAEGKSPASAGHVAIMKYLREKVLKPGLSVLELGCGAGGMLRFIEDEYNIGWGGGYYAKSVPHGSLVGVELVPGWVKFAQEHFKNISVYQGDITEYSLPEPYAGETFDLVMLNDVMEHVERTRYGCFFSQLDRVTSAGSLVYMHTPSPMAQLEEKQMISESNTQANENVVPHHFVVTGMATMGFELLSFEHDMDTVCGGEAKNLPKQLEGAHCYYNGWPKYTHNVFRKVHDPAVMSMA